MKYIPLTKGFFAKVDADWFGYLMQWKWHYNCGYAERKVRVDGKQVHISMHREIINAERGDMVDHKNGDTTDNQISNLRLATHSTNAMNMRKHKGASSYKGVSKNKNSWRTQIWIDNKKVLVLSFPQERWAALAYDLNAPALFGEYTRFNIGDELVSRVLNDCAEDPQSASLHTALS
jgi:hypothetical protein